MGECPELSPESRDAVWTALRARVRRWRVPPNYSRRCWWDEIEAEGRLAACRAIREYDPTRGVPLGAFLHRRVLTALRSFHRREWSYGRRHRPLPDGTPGLVEVGGEDHIAAEIVRLLDAIGGLGAPDRDLILRLCFAGETEAAVAAALGISQQAVSKRKRLALDRLRRLIAPDAD